MIVANGLPKSGTHALMAWLSKMGLKRCPGVLHIDGAGELGVNGNHLDVGTLAAVPDSVFIQGHVPATFDLRGFSVVTILRDPRNVLVSYVRHRAEPWGGDRKFTLDEAMDDFWGKPFVETYEGFLGWQGRSVVLRYENLAPEAIGAGCDIYDANRPEWDRWIGNTRTGSPSDWREHWTEEAEGAWQARGGVELVDRAGYGSHAWFPLQDEGGLHAA